MAKSSKGTKEFLITITEYLDEMAYKDEHFREAYSNPKKSIEECGDYIIGEVKKTGKNAFDPKEIFGMAIHYYQEDNVKVDKNAKKSLQRVISTKGSTDGEAIPYDPNKKQKVKEKKETSKKKKSTPDGSQAVMDFGF